LKPGRLHSNRRISSLFLIPARNGPNVNSRRCNLRLIYRRIVRPCQGRTFLTIHPWVCTHGYSCLCHFVARTVPHSTGYFTLNWTTQILCVIITIVRQGAPWQRHPKCPRRPANRL